MGDTNQAALRKCTQQCKPTCSIMHIANYDYRKPENHKVHLQHLSIKTAQTHLNVPCTPGLMHYNPDKIPTKHLEAEKDKYLTPQLMPL